MQLFWALMCLKLSPACCLTSSLFLRFLLLGEVHRFKVLHSKNMSTEIFTIINIIGTGPKHRHKEQAQ